MQIIASQCNILHAMPESLFNYIYDPRLTYMLLPAAIILTPAFGIL